MSMTVLLQEGFDALNAWSLVRPLATASLQNALFYRFTLKSPNNFCALDSIKFLHWLKYMRQVRECLAMEHWGSYQSSSCM